MSETSRVDKLDYLRKPTPLVECMYSCSGHADVKYPRNYRSTLVYLKPNKSFLGEVIDLEHGAEDCHCHED
jgi:hypothetical protein